MSFDSYLAALSAALKRGDSTEHTHRPALKSLIESLHPGIVATNEPKRIACGAPDYIVTKGHVPVGYVEAKDVNADLDDVQDSEQLKRYRASLRNLFLTDYLEFPTTETASLFSQHVSPDGKRTGSSRKTPTVSHKPKRSFKGGENPDDHFRQTAKMIEAGKTAAEEAAARAQEEAAEAPSAAKRDAGPDGEAVRAPAFNVD